MRKSALTLIIPLFLSVTAAFSADTNISPETVELVLEDSVIQEAAVSEEAPSKEKTLKEKLRDVYHLEISEYDKPSYLFSEILTHHYNEKSPLESTHLWGAYNGDIGLRVREDGAISNHYDSNALNLGFDGKFKNNNADFRIMLGFSPHNSRNFAQTLFPDVYIATNKIPHHRIIAGHTRPPVGKEGGNSAYTLPFLSRAQISRTYGTVRKVGVRVAGDYSFIDYDLGVFSSDSYFQEFFPGGEFVGWVNIKPLAKTDNKYGNLKIGAGLQSGHRSNSYTVAGAYVGYEYKRFMANFEWANADGYNGLSGKSTSTHSNGFYTTFGYMLTKKLQLLTRYDEFNPDKTVKHNNKREFSVGLNYFIKGQALRLIMNYVYAQNDAAKNSHRIIIGTQILI